VRLSTKGPSPGIRSPCIPTQYWKTHRAVGCCTGGPWWVGTVASCSFNAWRLRYANAASTSKPTVITSKSAMIRAGLLREREEAKKRGSLRKRTPRAARAWPLSPAKSS
jgi:hypothetical protein